MPVLRYYSSIAQQTTLSGSISAGATSITVGATTGFPSSFPYTVALDYGAATEELVDVTAAAGTNLTVTRGVDGTSAQSHSLGAVVRHVASGRDFSDYQTHQAASSGVHGVTGSVVGTSDTQTLANKTLTSPTINTPTTTNPTITSGGSWDGGPTFTGASAGANGIQIKVTGDANPRLLVGADGKQTWGNGTGTGDATLSRSGAAQLNTNSSLSYTRTATTDIVISSLVTGDTFDRARIYTDGKIEMGPGNAARDLTLSRSGVGILSLPGQLSMAPTQTSGTNLLINYPAGFSGNTLDLQQNGTSRFHVDQDGNLVCRNIYTGPYDPFTATWTASTTNPTLGNGSLVARYATVGKICHFYIVLAFGSTTNAGNGNYSFALPLTAANNEIQVVNGQAATTSRGPISCTIAQSATTLQIYGFTSTTSSAQGQIGSSGLYGVAWANGHFIRIAGTYETA